MVVVSGVCLARRPVAGEQAGAKFFSRMETHSASARIIGVVSATSRFIDIQTAVDNADLEVHEIECIKADRVLFSGVSFVLRGGELLRVEGANGSGKTSLLRILCGLSRPSRGRVMWGGADVCRQARSIHADLALVTHQPGVKGALTAEENLNVAQQLSGAPRGLPINEALAQVGLRDFEDIPCHYLSEGQRRRVALARLLVNRARLWVLDEPLTALDVEGVKMVEGLLARQLASGGMVVMTTHQSVNIGSHQSLNLSLREAQL